VGDPVGSGFARSLAQPGGNITGISLATGEIARKQVELLRIVVPRVSRLAIMIGRNPAAREVARPVQVAAREAGLASELDVVTSIPDLDRTFARDPAGSRAVFILSVPVVTGGSKAVAELALRNRVPTISGASEYVEAGCLLSYTLLHENALQRWAAQLDKIFRGANPAQIPFELPTKTQFAINRATARALGLPVPAELLLRADQVVD
jgi:putative ABC transport system substrate-binding protein